MSVYRENPTRLMIQDALGVWWVRHDPEPGWVHLGYAPEPASRWRWLVHDVAHGVLMRYRLTAVLSWSLRRFVERGAT